MISNEVFVSKCTPITNDSSLPRLVFLNLESSLSAINFNMMTWSKLLDMSTLIRLMTMITYQLEWQKYVIEQ